MNLTGYTLLDWFGTTREELTGEYSSGSLANEMVVSWVPIIDCHRKCERADDCRYAPSRQGEEIRCGIGKDVINNFVNATFGIMDTLDRDQIQGYLDGALHLTKFVLGAEGYIGACSNSTCIEGYGRYSPGIFGSITRLRRYLDALATSWKTIPELHATQHVMLLEGQSEKAFLDELRKTHLHSFLDLNTDVYGGSGNLNRKRIQMTLDRYARQGYVIYAQGDGDGKPTNPLKRLIERGIVEERNTFVFEHDFETAIPLRLLHLALLKMGLLNIPFRPFHKALQNNVGSIINRLKSELGIDLSDHKVELAKVVASALRGIGWWRVEDVLKGSELAQFLDFVHRAV